MRLPWVDGVLCKSFFRYTIGIKLYLFQKLRHIND